MILIGELLNSTRKRVRAALEIRDTAFVQDLARRQADAGVQYIDLNTGALLDREVECMQWLVRTVREVTDRPLCIDSPNPDALAAALDLAGPGTLINSISAEARRYEDVLPLVRKHQAPVIALGMDDEGLPEDADRGYEVLAQLITRLERDGVAPGNIFADPLVRPAGANTAIPPTVLDVISRIRAAFPQVHISGGISNVSHGLPARKLINRTFLTLAMSRGLDAAILDPLDTALMSEIAAAELLLGRDSFAMNFISLYRAGRLEEKP
ncbi:MAG: dihydropteroate synthase [Candidatus Sumerlaeia bacterium]|nr:dihydropteroate synthase [Candidatus Sumerlaeia bacterium]